MNDKLKQILSNMKKYNAGIMFQEVFGFEPETEYDALVIAPGWKTTKILRDPAYKVTELAVHSYQSGYLVEKDGLKVAWAVGGLSKNFEIGDFCTPEVNISAVYANQYLQEKLSDFHTFEKIYPNLEFSKNVIELAKDNGYSVYVSANMYDVDMHREIKNVYDKYGNTGYIEGFAKNQTRHFL